MKHKIIIIYLLLLGNTQSYPMTAKNSLAALHEHCAIGNKNATKSLLHENNDLLNQRDTDGKTALHIACSNGNDRVVTTLINYASIEANLLTFCGQSPLHLTINKKTLEKESYISTIQALIGNKKVNIHQENSNNQTFFYTAYTNKDLRNPYYDKKFGQSTDTFNTAFANEIIKMLNLTDEQKKYFMTHELHKASLLRTTSRAVTDRDGTIESLETIPSFIAFCLQHGADINARINNNRPIDHAYKRYRDTLQYIPNNSFHPQEAIYYAFMQYTPYIFDKELYYRLWKNHSHLDSCKKIMGYYAALTVERRFAAEYKRTVTGEKKYDFMHLPQALKTYCKEKLLQEQYKRFGWVVPFNAQTYSNL